jgi:alpha-L-rhamnosidase
MILASLLLMQHQHLASPAHLTSQSASYVLQDLSVEHLQAPADGVTLLAIDVPRPRLSWRLVPLSTLRGVSQSAYRVLVTSIDKSVIWDSGRVSSNRTNLVECCALSTLHSDTEYSWCVTSWDHMGLTTNSSASFHTGLFNGSSWRGSDWLGAQWITTGLQKNLLRSPPVHLAAPVASASAFVAGVGYFELRVNGKRVGTGRKFDPGWTEYAKRTNYVAFDLAPFLHVGGNVVGVELGNSWYQQQGWYQLPPYYYEDRGLKVTLGCSTAASPSHHGQGTGTCNGGGFAWPNPNQLLLRAKITLTTGAVITHTSGQGWTTSNGPVVFNSIYDGEHYDARLEQPGWDQLIFNPPLDHVWTSALIVNDTDNALANATLSSQLYEPIRVVEEEVAHSTWISNGSYIFDFGRNMVGVIRLKITQPVAGRTVTLKHAEAKMHPPFGPADGSLYYGSLRNAHATDYYTMKGSDAEVYEPKFTSHGFRFLELSGLTYAPQEGDVVRLVTHADITSRSSLMFNERGAEILNSITQGCRNSIVGNLLG